MVCGHVRVCTCVHKHSLFAFMRNRIITYSATFLVFVYIFVLNPIHINIQETKRKSAMSRKHSWESARQKAMYYLEHTLPGYLIQAFELILQPCTHRGCWLWTCSWALWSLLRWARNWLIVSSWKSVLLAINTFILWTVLWISYNIPPVHSLEMKTCLDFNIS